MTGNRSNDFALDLANVVVLVDVIEMKSDKVLEKAEEFTSKPHGEVQSTRALPVDKSALRSYLKGLNTLGTRLKFKLIAGSLPLNFLTHRPEESQARACPICGHPVEDTVHFLIKCVGYRSARDALFQSIAEHVPQGLFEEFSMLKSAAKAGALISNVFWGAYGDEVDVFVRGFLEKIWKVRDRIANIFFEGIHVSTPLFMFSGYTFWSSCPCHLSSFFWITSSKCDPATWHHAMHVSDCITHQFSKISIP